MDSVKRDGILEKVKKFLDEDFQEINIKVHDEGYIIMPARIHNIIEKGGEKNASKC